METKILENRFEKKWKHKNSGFSNLISKLPKSKRTLSDFQLLRCFTPMIVSTVKNWKKFIFINFHDFLHLNATLLNSRDRIHSKLVEMTITVKLKYNKSLRRNFKTQKMKHSIEAHRSSNKWVCVLCIWSLSFWSNQQKIITSWFQNRSNGYTACYSIHQAYSQSHVILPLLVNFSAVLLSF